MTSTTNPTAIFAGLVNTHIGGCSADDVVLATQNIRRVQGWLDSFEAKLMSHSNSLYASGAGTPAPDTKTRDGRVSSKTAKTKNRRSKLLDEVKGFDKALVDGDITAEHVDVLANATTRIDDEIRQELLDLEHELLNDAKRCSPEDFRRICSDVIDRLRQDHGIKRAEKQRNDTTLTIRVDPRTGMYLLNGRFDPETGARIFTAIDAETKKLIKTTPDGWNVDRDQVQAKAMANLVAAGKHEVHPSVVEISVLIDLETLIKDLHDKTICEMWDGTRLPAETVRRLACDADIIPIVLNAEGVPLDVGRKQRLANRDQRRALRAMYRTCAFSGCDTTFDKCEIHHLLEWEDLGDTDLDNLLPLCSRHHHVIHEGGWKLHLSTGRDLTITQPDGQVFATVPVQMLPVLRDPKHRKHDRHREREPGHQTEHLTLAI